MLTIPPPSRPHRQAFTLVELLVVMAIIAVLIALILPAVQYAREAARRAQCLGNMHQLGIALMNHHDSRNGFPSGSSSGFNTFGDVKANALGWLARILPKLDEAAMFNALNFRRPWAAPENSTVARNRLSLLFCPSKGSSEAAEEWNERYNLNLAGTDYVGIGAVKLGQNNGTIGYHTHVNIRDIRDGSTYTIMAAETRSVLPAWIEGHASHTFVELGMNASDSTLIPGYTLEPTGSLHPGGVVHLFADGRARFLGEHIDLEIYKALATTNGADRVSSADF